MLRRTLSLLLLLAAGASMAGADTLYTLKSHADAFEVAGQKQPAKDSRVQVWAAADRLRRDEDGQSMILRLDRNLLILVDHEEKTYSEIALPVDLRRMMPPGQETLADQIAGGMKVTVQVTPRDETRKVQQWNARRYDVAIQSAMGMKIDTTLWLSRDVEGYAPLNRLSAAVAALQPGSAAWVQELEKLDGYPVLQESRVDALGARFSTREELLAVETRDAPPGHYAPPAGYRAEPYNPIAGMSR